MEDLKASKSKSGFLNPHQDQHCGLNPQDKQQTEAAPKRNTTNRTMPDHPAVQSSPTAFPLSIPRTSGQDHLISLIPCIQSGTVSLGDTVSSVPESFLSSPHSHKIRQGFLENTTLLSVGILVPKDYSCHISTAHEKLSFWPWETGLENRVGQELFQPHPSHCH